MALPVKAEHKKRRIANETRQSLQESEDKMNAALHSPNLDPPSWLCAAGKKKFRKYVEQLTAVNMITGLDVECLAELCNMQVRSLQMEKLIRKQGLMIGDKLNPLVQEQRQTLKVIYSYQAKLGLNPSDRLRFVKPDSEEVDELEAFRDEL